MLSDQAILEAAISKAQAYANQNGLSKGQLVAHPSYERKMRLKEITGERAVVIDVDDEGRDVKANEMTFPLCEVFDPKIAHDLALQIKREQLA